MRICCALLLVLLAHDVEARPLSSQSTRRRAGAPSSLPPGWREANDPRSGRAYYWNVETKATTWVRPEAAATKAQTSAPPTPAKHATAATPRANVVAATDAVEPGSAGEAVEVDEAVSSLAAAAAVDAPGPVGRLRRISSGALAWLAAPMWSPSEDGGARPAPRIATRELVAPEQRTPVPVLVVYLASLFAAGAAFL